MKFKSIISYIKNHLGGDTISFNDFINILQPVVFEQFTISSAAIINSILISSNGNVALSSVSTIDTINLLFMNIFISVAIGGTAVIANYCGKKEKENIEKSIVQCLLSTTAIASLIAVILLLFNNAILKSLLKDLGPEIMSISTIYFAGMCISLPLSGFFNASIAALRGTGKTNITMKIMFISTALNIIVSYITVRYLNLGILGLIITVLITRTVGSIISLKLIIMEYPSIKQNYKKYMKPDKKILKAIMYISIPGAIEQVVFHGGKIVMQGFILSMGIYYITANAIVMSVFNLYQIVFQSMQICTSTIIAICLGASNSKDAKKFLISLSTATNVILLFVFLISYPFLDIIIGLFSKDAKMVLYVKNMLTFIILSYSIFIGYGGTMASGLRVAGCAKIITIISVISMWVVRISIGYILAIVFDFKLYGIYIAMIAEHVVRSIFFIIIYKKGDWAHFRLV